MERMEEPRMAVWICKRETIQSYPLNTFKPAVGVEEGRSDIENSDGGKSERKALKQHNIGYNLRDKGDRREWSNLERPAHEEMEEVFFCVMEYNSPFVCFSRFFQ